MRVLVHSRFYPNIGGIETVASLLAHEWHRAGAGIIVVSDVQCASTQRRHFPFPIHYRPNPLQWLQLLRWADVFVHMNISLKALWPWLIVRRPFVAVHHTFYYSDRTGYRGWRERLKLRVMARAVNISVCHEAAKRLPKPCFVILNPVDLSLFQADSNMPRHKDLVFVGRLVSDKGCDLLIQALGQLVECGLQPLLTVIGDGPERSTLERLAASLNLQDRVAFAGAQPPEKVANWLRQHNIMVVPSIWEEIYPVIVLEGAASGCIVLGSDGGGLPEVIGPCGITFRRGDLSDLTSKLANLLQHREEWDHYRAGAPAHLELHHSTRVAQRYLEVFERAVKGLPVENNETRAWQGVR